MKSQNRDRTKRIVLFAILGTPAVAYAIGDHDASSANARPIDIASRPIEALVHHQPAIAFTDSEHSSCMDDDSVDVWLGPHGGARNQTPGFGVARPDSQNASILALLGIANTKTPTIDASTPEPLALKVFCLKPEYGAPCSNRCIAKGIGCAPLYKHPYKSDVGWGKLFSCNTLIVGHMGGFHYPNGDDCYVAFPSLMPTLCSYSGDG